MNLEINPIRHNFKSSFPAQFFLDPKVAPRALLPRESVPLRLSVTDPSVRIDHMLSSDPRFTISARKMVFRDGKAGKKNGIFADAYYDLQQESLENNYIPRNAIIKPGTTSELEVFPLLTNGDIVECRRAKQVWKKLNQLHQTTIDAQLTVTSSIETVHTIDVTANLAPVRVLPLATSSITFNLTHVHQRATEALVLNNPTMHPIFARIQPMLDYIRFENLTNFLGVTDRDMDDSAIAKDMFFISDSMEDYNLTVPRTQLSSHQFILPPMKNTTVYVTFHPENTGVYHAVYLIRNNFSIAEKILFTGEAGKSAFGFSNSQLYFSEGSFIFPITTEDLQYCSRPQGILTSDLTRRFSFNLLMINKGNMPAIVEQIGINGRPCEGSGFAISKCEPFVLKPKVHRRLTVSFFPDFTTSTVAQQLTVKVLGLEEMSFSIKAVLPADIIRQCFNALPGSDWEPRFKSSSISAALFLVFIIIIREFIWGPKGKPRLMTRSTVARKKPRPDQMNSPTVAIGRVLLSQAPRKGFEDELEGISESETDDVMLLGDHPFFWTEPQEAAPSEKQESPPVPTMDYQTHKQRNRISTSVPLVKLAHTDPPVFTPPTSIFSTSSNLSNINSSTVSSTPSPSILAVPGKKKKDKDKDKIGTPGDAPVLSPNPSSSPSPRKQPPILKHPAASSDSKASGNHPDASSKPRPSVRFDLTGGVPAPTAKSTNIQVPEKGREDKFLRSSLVVPPAWRPAIEPVPVAIVSEVSQKSTEPDGAGGATGTRTSQPPATVSGYGVGKMTEVLGDVAIGVGAPQKEALPKKTEKPASNTYFASAQKLTKEQMPLVQNADELIALAKVRPIQCRLMAHTHSERCNCFVLIFFL